MTPNAFDARVEADQPKCGTGIIAFRQDHASDAVFTLQTHGNGRFAVELAVRRQSGERTFFLSEVYPDVANRGVEEAEHGSDTGAQLEARAFLRLCRLVFCKLTGGKQALEELPAVIARTDRLHFPDIVVAKPAIHADMRNDIEGQIREAECSWLVVGAKCNPALNRNVFTLDGKVIQPRQSIVAMADVEFQYRLSSRRFAPSHVGKDQVGVAEIRLHADSFPALALVADGYDHRHRSAKDVLRTKTQLLSCGLVENG